MKVTYLEDGVRKSITCDHFTSSYDHSVEFFFKDYKNDFRVLVTLPNTLIEKIENI